MARFARTWPRISALQRKWNAQAFSSCACALCTPPDTITIISFAVHVYSYLFLAALLARGVNPRVCDGFLWARVTCMHCITSKATRTLCAPTHSRTPISISLNRIHKIDPAVPPYNPNLTFWNQEGTKNINQISS